MSFAAALLDQPPLLILDEPTVGVRYHLLSLWVCILPALAPVPAQVDPLLRARLWAYLQELTAPGSRTSVLITTHYIDEAAQAHMVGMMRHGRLLAEEPPQQLMRRFSAVTLEDVFLHLCRGTSLNGHKGIADDDSEEAEAAAQQQQQHVRDALALPANSINSPASAATATVVVKRDGHYSDDDGDGERPTNTKSRRGRHAEAEPLLGTTTTTKDVVVPKVGLGVSACAICVYSWPVFLRSKSSVGVLACRGFML